VTRREHTDTEYEAKLLELRNRLVSMARHVRLMIADSFVALSKGDVTLAERTIETDHMVNRMEVEADELCLLILAKWNPVASDLRFVTLALKMVTDLERIGDLCVNICERALALSKITNVELPDKLSPMVEVANSMVGDAIQSFVEQDVGLAEEVLARDEEVDRLYASLVREHLSRVPEDPAALERAMHFMSVAKWVERMADHATNLVEQVIFMVKGKDIRHIGKLDGD
jgi:phosphate transport system protein